MKKYLVAFFLLVGFNHSQAFANSDNWSSTPEQNKLDLSNSVPTSLDYNLDSGNASSPSFVSENQLRLDLEEQLGSSDQSLRDQVLARITPLGFRVGDSSYLNVSLEKGVMVGVTIPWQGEGL